MNRQKQILMAAALALMAAAAVLLFNLKNYQRLGEPGVKTRPIAGSKNLEILMPETLPDCTSEILTNIEANLAVLPPDTSYRCRQYQTPDRFAMEVTTVLMGSDRSSIHAPQICLTGQGWIITDGKTLKDTVPIQQPSPYDLPVNKLIAVKQFKDQDGNPVKESSVFLYWFVDGKQFTANEWKRKLWLVPHDLLTTGILDRWAYIACFSPCVPGQEEATCARMKKMIAETVPEFQLVPQAGRPGSEKF